MPRGRTPYPPATERKPEPITAARREIEALVLEYRRIQEQIRVRSPRYASLTQPSPVTIDGIRAEVLDIYNLDLDSDSSC
jgi:hypothetical protein